MIELRVDTPLIVWQSEGSGKHNMHFSHWNDREQKIECFRNGRTSHSGPRFTEIWNFYEEVENENQISE